MSLIQKSPFVLPLADAAATLEQVGGKGASLARLATAGLPVPAGFHITTAAYRRFVVVNGLQEQILAVTSANAPATFATAAEQIARLFLSGVVPEDIAAAIRRAYAELGGSELPVAVRSSATAEDLPELSFAGQQETYLNMHGEAMVLAAVKRCWASLWTARAMAYRAQHGIAPDDVSLAVVVQALVPADAAGILFTANPLTGARDQVVINAAWGLGEAVVGGQVTPDTVVVAKSDGRILEQQINDKLVMTVRTSDGTHEEPVPPDQRARPVLSPAQVAELARSATQIESLYGQPMDIEWALHASHFYILQARPITTLHHRASEEWNDSLNGDYLWTNGNLGEAMPGVMTPCTWSLMQIFMTDAMASSCVAPYRAIGIIGGRAYMNLSMSASLAAVFGVNTKKFIELTEDVFGQLPAGVEIPVVKLPRWQVLRLLLPVVLRVVGRIRRNQKRLPTFLTTAAERCTTLYAQIQATTSAAELVKLWHGEVLPYFHECSQMLEASTKIDGNALIMTRRRLKKFVGEEDANALISGLHGAGALASLGPLIGLTQLARGEIDRATYTRLYGHRSPHEFEVSTPRPAEDPQWIERELADLRKAPVDVTTLLARQHAANAAAWQRFCVRYPRKASAMRRQIDHAAAVFRNREAARSEVVRVFGVLRAFVLRAGVLTGYGDNLFFLSIDEILAVLGGDISAIAHVSARRATYARYSALPPYPTLISGQFDPAQWAADPQRRSDIFDAHGQQAPAGGAITGFPGATGIVEGIVRVIAAIEEGEQLQAGEILVTTATNVGWTPLFPRAAAIVTDIGAPLSHAAIVARELGIPAVVGCGNATMRLHTGDRVRVNGGLGTVEVLTTAE